MRALLTLGLLTARGCESTAFATQAGDHVVYHWNVATWAAEDERLCGGTVAAADQLVTTVSTHYGWSLPADGPTIEYFWDRQLAVDSCAAGVSECVHGGYVIFSYLPLDSHELAHAAQGAHDSLSFIDEGLASRWESGMVDSEPTLFTSATFFNEAELRAQLQMRIPQDLDDLDYERAMTWLIALETTFGPARVSEFIGQLGKSSSPDDVERALQSIFGISLAESVALAESLPESRVDDPICGFANLPTWDFDEDLISPIYIDRGDAHCDDDDLISVHGQRATWLFAIELPESQVSIAVETTLPTGVELDRQMVTLATCNGKLDIEPVPFSIFAPGDPKTLILSGRHVGALTGEVEPDGTVHLPRISFEVVP
jgi:hypothetical protein